MKKARKWIAAVCAAVLILCPGTAWGAEPEKPVSEANAANFGRLLTDLVKASEDPSGADERTVTADLKAIWRVSRRDHALAKAIADQWRRVYLDPDYRLMIYHGTKRAEELEDSGIPQGSFHAIVVLGYELLDGEMQPELTARCDAAAAAARSFPQAVLVCSGGATGENNPEGHTEAGLMKEYLVKKCGIKPSRIFTDERAMNTVDNAFNTLEILQIIGIRTMTIVTSAYHQRRGQALYNAVAALYRQQYGYSVEIVGNYNCDVEPTVPYISMEHRLTARQLAGILQLPEEVVDSLPSMRPPARPGESGEEESLPAA